MENKPNQKILYVAMSKRVLTFDALLEYVKNAKKVDGSSLKFVTFEGHPLLEITDLENGL